MLLVEATVSAVMSLVCLANVAVFGWVLVYMYLHFWRINDDDYYYFSGTEWPILCWCAVKKLLTHSLIIFRLVSVIVNRIHYWQFSLWFSWTKLTLPLSVRRLPRRVIYKRDSDAHALTSRSKCVMFGPKFRSQSAQRWDRKLVLLRPNNSGLCVITIMPIINMLNLGVFATDFTITRSVSLSRPCTLQKQLVGRNELLFGRHIRLGPGDISGYLRV